MERRKAVCVSIDTTAAMTGGAHQATLPHFMLPDGLSYFFLITPSQWDADASPDHIVFTALAVN